MAAGTAAGGWRIIRTLGHKMVKLQPVHGFAAETTAAIIIQTASSYGIPLSTTHVISTSIMGVGAVKRFSGVKWTVVERIVWAWDIYSACYRTDQLRLIARGHCFLAISENETHPAIRAPLFFGDFRARRKSSRRLRNSSWKKWPRLTRR